MTYEESITALELCGDENNCTKCPFRDKRFEPDISCAEELMKLAAETIKNLAAEIERLQEENKSIRYCYEQAKSYNDKLAESCEKNCKKFNMTTRAEAIKEFAERLKQMPSVTNCEYEWLHLDIDTLAKKLTEHKETVSMIDGHIEE